MKPPEGPDEDVEASGPTGVFFAVRPPDYGMAKLPFSSSVVMSLALIFALDSV